MNHAIRLGCQICLKVIAQAILEILRFAYVNDFV